MLMEILSVFVDPGFPLACSLRGRAGERDGEPHDGRASSNRLALIGRCRTITPRAVCRAPGSLPMAVALVSVLGPDRIGLVASIADELFGAGVSLRDTTFAALGSGAEFTAVCDLPDGVAPEEIEAGAGRPPPAPGR